MSVRLSVKQVEEFRSVMASLDGLQIEISAAVKRKAAEPITSFQLKLINGVIEKANALIGVARPVAGFDGFEEDDIPVASDVSMVVSQYVEAFEKIRCENIEKHYDGTWRWSGAPTIQTVPPRARK